MSAQDFTEDQRRYLEGFVSGVQARRAAQGLKPLGSEGGASAQPARPDNANPRSRTITSFIFQPPMLNHVIRPSGTHRLEEAAGV